MSITETALQWFISYLAEITQSVWLNQTLSKGTSPIYGLPQLYKSFHPDRNVSAVASNEVEECCLAVTSWMSANKLKLNDDKTETILCGSTYESRFSIY
jgi:hypothetical protein